MAIIPIGEKYVIYDYSTNKTYEPLEGQKVYLKDVEPFIQNVVSVIGDGTSLVENLPFREIVNIEISSDISLVSLRISGNRVMIQNTSSSSKLINIGTTGTPVFYELPPRIAVIMKFDGANWILLTDAIKAVTIDADYVIPNKDFIYYYKIDTLTNKQVIITLPLLSANTGKEPFVIQNVGPGIVRVVRNSTDTINGLTELRLYSENNFVEIYPKIGEWGIRNQHVTIDSGRIRTNDWTLRSLGCANIGYDNVVSGSPKIGGFVDGVTSGARGKIAGFTGSTLFLIEVSNDGIFLNNEQILGDGFTFDALVNEPSGNSLNKDTSIFIFQMGDYINRIEKSFVVYLSDADNNYVEPIELSFSQGPPVENFGYSYFWFGNDEIGIRTSQQGLAYVGFGGGRVTLDTQNWYYRHFFTIHY